jgi:hypothetical protein
MHECNAQTLILPPFGPKRWDVTGTAPISLTPMTSGSMPPPDAGAAFATPTSAADHEAEVA